VVKAAEALNGPGYKDHDLYVVHERVPFDICPGLQKPAGVVDAIVSGVSGLSRNSALCTKSMFSQCLALATNSSFQDPRHRFLIKSRREKSKLRKKHGGLAREQQPKLESQLPFKYLTERVAPRRRICLFFSDDCTILTRPNNTDVFISREPPSLQAPVQHSHRPGTMIPNLIPRQVTNVKICMRLE
jgi:hypothetical protein